MSLTGITVSDDCVTTFNDMKTSKKFQYIIFTIKDQKEVVIGETGVRGASYDDFVAKLENDQPCYAVFDFEYDTPDGKRGKLLFFSWIPDTAKVRPKMIYASTKEGLKQKIEGGLVDVQATDASMTTIEHVMMKIKQHSN